MYEFVTHTWNTVKGECYHDCSYCYMKRWGKLNPVRFDEKELKTDLGSGNFIFVGSSCDMWAENIPDKWIFKTLISEKTKKVTAIEKQRTSKNAMNRLKELVLNECPKSSNSMITISHCGGQKRAEILASELSTALGIEKIPVIC